VIDFDCETTGFQPYSGRQRAFLWTFYDGTGEPEALYPDVEADRQRIQWWLDRGAEEGLRAWNTKFDRSWADVDGFRMPPDGCYYDGMVEAHAVNERRSVALKSVSVELLGDDADDLQKQVKSFLTEERRRRAKAAKEAGVLIEEPNYSDVPRELMEVYALEDVILTRKVCNQLAITLENAPDLKGLVEFERKAMDALYAVEKRGLPADDQGYRNLELEVIENLETLEDRVLALAAEGDPKIYAKEMAKDPKDPDEAVETDETGKIISYGKDAKHLADFNPNSSAQILAALKARGADMTFMSVEDGKVSADADNLRAVDDELAGAILEFRSEKKVLSTYVRPMIDRHYESSMRSWKEPFIAPDGRIHATYRQVGARTGRMSCADPNMQNQPRDDLRLRYNIRAEPGFKLVACDLSNIEMVLFAAYAGEGRLLQTIREGGDLHTLTAEGLGFRDRRRPGGGYESARQQGKVFNFTKIYGGGLRSIRRYFRVPIDQARLYNRRYNDLYPEIQNLTRVIEYKLADRGYVQDKLISGRRFRVEPRESYKAVNYLIQGTAAALLKYALIKLHEDGVPVVALVHDEIVAHVPEKDAEEVKRLIIERMTEFEALKEIVPLKAEGDIIDRWSQAKSMDFVPKFAGGEG
jgi:DNA polymerase I-like protein with 3'-5' exonuclease and polymerase domains